MRDAGITGSNAFIHLLPVAVLEMSRELLLQLALRQFRANLPARSRLKTTRRRIQQSLLLPRRSIKLQDVMIQVQVVEYLPQGKLIYSASYGRANSSFSEFMHQKAIIREHIDAFFDNIYPIPGMGFIHRPSLMRTWLDGSHSPRLLQAICGVAARFTAQSRPNMALQGQRWLEEAEMHLQHRSTDLLRTDIAALILIAFDHGVSRRFLKHISTLASVTRLAVIMRLHHEVPNLVFRRQEWRRRLIWAIWAMDAISSGGCSDLSSCPTKLMHARLPCNERSYNFNVAVDVHPLGSRPQSDGCGLSAYLVSILDVRRRFLE